MATYVCSLDILVELVEELMCFLDEKKKKESESWIWDFLSYVGLQQGGAGRRGLGLRGVDSSRLGVELRCIILMHARVQNCAGLAGWLM